MIIHAMVGVQARCLDFYCWLFKPNRHVRSHSIRCQRMLERGPTDSPLQPSFISRESESPICLRGQKATIRSSLSDLLGPHRSLWRTRRWTVRDGWRAVRQVVGWNPFVVHRSCAKEVPRADLFECHQGRVQGRVCTSWDGTVTGI